MCQNRGNLTQISCFITRFQLHVKKQDSVATQTIRSKLSPMKQCDHSSIIKMSSVHLHTRTQTSLPLSNCSTDDLVVTSGPLLHESFNDVVDVTLLETVNF